MENLWLEYFLTWNVNVMEQSKRSTIQHIVIQSISIGISLIRCSPIYLTMKSLLSLKNVPFTAFDQVRYVSSKTAAVTKIHRTIYCRMYPTLLVQPDGSTITVRYHEPREIVRVCISNLQS